MLLLLPAWLYSLALQKDHILSASWFFGLGFFGAGISWVHVSIATFGGVHLIVSIFLMLLLCGYLASYIALFAFLLKRFFPISLWPLAAPAIWLLTEWLRAHMLSGFPWLSIGYSQTNSIFSAYYPIIGEIGLSAIIVFIAAVLTSAGVLRNKKAYLVSLSVVLVLSVGAVTLKKWPWTSATGEQYSVAMVQGNIEQSMRWRPELDRPTMEKYLALTEPVWGSDLIIWPEAAIPRLEPLALEFIANTDAKAFENKSALLTGIVNYNYETDRAFNSMLGLGMFSPNQDEAQYRYGHDNRFSKHHLLPIGEFVPFETILRPLAPIFDLPMSSFTRGDFVQDNLRAKGLHLLPAICFEIAFPLQIAANLTQETDAIVTVSNDAWFGDSHGPHQHLQIARVRAMEFALPVLRATNTGITAAYDHQGKLIDKLPQFTEGVLQFEIATVNGSTPYAKFGNLPILVICSLGMLFALFIRRQYSIKTE